MGLKLSFASATLWLLCWEPVPAHAQAALPRRTIPPQAEESQVKAGLLYNFAQFTEWPASPEPLVFCVIGSPGIGQYLKANVTGKRLGSRRIDVRPEATLAEAATCHLLYLGPGAAKQASAIREAVTGKPVLLVGDDPNTGAHGVTICFYLDEERVRFEIHRKALAKSGVHISSRLLSLARLRD